MRYGCGTPIHPCCDGVWIRSPVAVLQMRVRRIPRWLRRDVQGVLEGLVVARVDDRHIRRASGGRRCCVEAVCVWRLHCCGREHVQGVLFEGHALQCGAGAG